MALMKWNKYNKETARIEKLADQWCTDNGYPVPKLRWVYRGIWTQIEKRNK